MSLRRRDRPPCSPQCTSHPNPPRVCANRPSLFPHGDVMAAGRVPGPRPTLPNDPTPPRSSRSVAWRSRPKQSFPAGRAAANAADGTRCRLAHSSPAAHRPCANLKHTQAWGSPSPRVRPASRATEHRVVLSSRGGGAPSNLSYLRQVHPFDREIAQLVTVRGPRVCCTGRWVGWRRPRRGAPQQHQPNHT